MTPPPPPTPATAEPSGRTIAGIFAILALILLWAVLVASLSRWVQQWPGLVQALFYLATGMIWVTPLKPLLRWMEAGRKRG